jgi:uncharacterized protein with HEPN domain
LIRLKFDIDAEAIYKVCTDHVKMLAQVIKKIMKEVQDEK